jgi:D-sedoheptulose 7-phosphate isomerase
MIKDFASAFRLQLREHIRVVELLEDAMGQICAIAQTAVQAIAAGHKVVWCGNGGSAADSQHLAAELVVRFKRARGPLPSIALTTDSSVLTAIANDFGYDKVFSRQVQALCQPGDVLIGISTSGNSPNIIAALKQAREAHVITVALTGQDGGKLNGIAEYHLNVQSAETARIQEAHILIGHLICDYIECDLLR